MLIIWGVILAFFVFILILYFGGVPAVAIAIAWLIIIAALFITALLLAEFYRVIFKNQAPYVRSSRRLIKRVIQEIDFKPGSIVCELGCGDALFLRLLAKEKNVQAIGYEYFILPYIIGRIISFFRGDNIKIHYKNFLNVDLRDADYIFCYLIDEEMAKLEEKLKQELKPGAILISNTFKFKDWPPDKFIMLDKKRPARLSNKIYIYQR